MVWVGRLSSSDGKTDSNTLASSNRFWFLIRSNPRWVIDYRRILTVNWACVPSLITFLFCFLFSHNIQNCKLQNQTHEIVATIVTLRLYNDMGWAVPLKEIGTRWDQRCLVRLFQCVPIFFKGCSFTPVFIFVSSWYAFICIVKSNIFEIKFNDMNSVTVRSLGCDEFNRIVLFWGESPITTWRVTTSDAAAAAGGRVEPSCGLRRRRAIGISADIGRVCWPLCHGVCCVNVRASVTWPRCFYICMFLCVCYDMGHPAWNKSYD